MAAPESSPLSVIIRKLRHSPHSQHPGGSQHKEDIGTIDTDADGWADLIRQLWIDAIRGVSLEKATLSGRQLRMAIIQGGTWRNLAGFQDRGYAVDSGTLLSNVLRIQLRLRVKL